MTIDHIPVSSKWTFGMRVFWTVRRVTKSSGQYVLRMFKVSGCSTIPNLYIPLLVDRQSSKTNGINRLYSTSKKHDIDWYRTCRHMYIKQNQNSRHNIKPTKNTSQFKFKTNENMRPPYLLKKQKHLFQPTKTSHSSKPSPGSDACPSLYFKSKITNSCSSTKPCTPSLQGGKTDPVIFGHL